MVVQVDQKSLFPLAIFCPLVLAVEVVMAVEVVLALDVVMAWEGERVEASAEVVAWTSMLGPMRRPPCRT